MSWEDFVEQCEQVLLDVDDIPERGESFAEAVREKIESMKEWAEEHEAVTEKMVKALEGMAGGVAKWL